jgi:methylated-DNA-[protein]-cysteine S-methyltransferase
MILMSQIEDTPLGTIWLAANEIGLVGISLWDDGNRFSQDIVHLTGEEPALDHGNNPILVTTMNQLLQYLAGGLREFDVPLDWSYMKPFQRAVLELVCTVPHGQTTSYQAIANQLGKPGAVRAVGQANATNPIPIIIPCHRILGSDGKLHGYGARGGVETKAWLLRLEGSWLI